MSAVEDAWLPIATAMMAADYGALDRAAARDAFEAAIRAEEKARYAEVVEAVRVAAFRGAHPVWCVIETPRSGHCTCGLDGIIAAHRALENPIATA